LKKGLLLISPHQSSRVKGGRVLGVFKHYNFERRFQAMRVVLRGVSFWMFLVIWVLAGSAACWAQEDIINTESDESVVVLEVNEGQKVQLACKTEVGKKTWVFVNVPELVPGITYLLHYGFLFPLEEDSSDLYFSESASEDHIDLGLYDMTGLLPLAITSKIGSSSHHTDVVQTILLMSTGYDRDESLIDPDSLKDEDGRNKLLAKRTNGQKKANIVHVNSGMIIGIALRLYDKNQQVFSRFMSLAAAVNKGNNFLSYRELPGEREGYPENPMEIMEVETEESLIDLRGSTDIQTGNIRISVCKAPGINNYYNLRIYINSQYRITLYKPCNTCRRFTYNTGVSHARQLVSSLQGWD